MFLCVHRQEKLCSRTAVLTGNAIAITPSLYSSGNAFLYRSRHEINANITYFLASRQNQAVLQVVLPGDVRDLST